VVLAVAYGHAPPAIGDIVQVKPECLAGAQAALEHQAHQRQVTPAAQGAQQGRNLTLVERPWQTPDCLDLQRAAARGLAGNAGQEGTVPIRSAHQRTVRDVHNRVGTVKPPGHDRPVVKRRNRRERAVDSGGAQARQPGECSVAGG